ncbi:MAG: hypothetical protein ABSH41_05610 [Syntrophobacteraceae bacterium]|jgi:hypothetical protein
METRRVWYTQYVENRKGNTYGESPLSFFAVVVWLALLSGCTKEDVKTVSCHELEQISTRWKEPKVALWSYQGTQNGYHYFDFMDLPGLKQTRYRVSETEIQIAESFPLTLDKKRWRVLPWGPASIEARRKGIPQNVCGSVQFLQ